ncbi:uncharacterized protein [Porites lutea]|uniref:uncharacterized protein n=1 Tax=Porites lutea TaxID=51062 RepID=UPI003CC630F8
MKSSILITPSLLTLMLITRWFSNALPYEENLEASGQKEQHDPFPDPAGGFCQRNKNPAGLGFIGVKYDLLRGNPEGKHSLGGVDPGFDKTKRILKLTTDAGENVPIQVCYAERQSCSMSKSTKIFGGTKRYQDKLNVDVSAEAGYSGLFDFSFSLSAKYEEMKKSTQKGETVYRDCTEICNKGEARYQLKSVENEGWTLTDEFAASVCGLTVKFKKREEKKKYIDFLKYWGTHVVVKVVLGTKKITRFRSSLKEFMSYASENVGSSVSVSGGYGGATGSVSVDVSTFEESEETKKDFGEQQLVYTVGGDSLPEPIQVTLLGIEETLEPKFWSNLGDLQKKKSCKRMSSKKLKKFLRNMKQAIKAYPKEMKVKRAMDNPMELQLSWPSGYFSLFTASKDGTDVCPQGTGFKWRPGSVTDPNHVLIASTNLEFIGVGAYVGVKYGFCTKTKEPGSSYFSQVWPSGKYCILRKSSNPGNPSCPKNFEAASVTWKDDWGNFFPTPDGHLKYPVKEGTYPDGSFDSDSHLKIEFCCRQDGFVDNGIHLPLENPFILVRVQGFSCQRVCGAQVTDVAVRTAADSPMFEAPNSEINGNVKPFGMVSRQEVELRFCHYKKLEDAKFVRLDLIETPMKARTAERECQSRGGHLASIHSQDENRTIKEMVGSGSLAWIGLKRRTVQNRPWVWTDDTELDFGEWKPDVTDDENYVSISGDDGLWKAKTNDAKLPFVCKVIDNCP